MNNNNSGNRGSNLTLILMMVAAFFLMQYLMPRPQPKQAIPATAKAVTLPPAFNSPSGGLQTELAREQFHAALQELADAQSLPHGSDYEKQRQQHYTDALKDLQKVQNEKKTDPEKVDSAAASLEIAYIQWKFQEQWETAALTVNQAQRLMLPSSTGAPVFDGKNWTVQPVAAYSDRLFSEITADFKDHNLHATGAWGWVRLDSYRFIQFFVQACSFAGRDYKDAVALIILGAIVTLLLTPLRNWQYKAMARASREQARVQPLLKKIQQEHKGDQAEIARRQMELYKEHGISPYAGCSSMLPMVVQIPFMWWLYYAIRLYRFELNGKFLWIGSSFAWHHQWSAPQGPILALNLAHIDVPLLALYTASMYVSTKLMPVSSPDPEQARQSQKMSLVMSLFMPVLFYSYGWPSAFILWWLAMNVTQTLVTIFYLRRHPEFRAAMVPSVARASSTTATEAPSKGAAKSSSGNGSGNGSAATSKPQSSAQKPGKAPASNGSGDPDDDAADGSRSTDGMRRIEPKNRRKPRGQRRF